MKWVRAVAGGEATARMSKERKKITTSMRKKEQELDLQTKGMKEGGREGRGKVVLELDVVGLAFNGLRLSTGGK